MLINNEALAQEQLKNISYYRLKGYWWDLQCDKVNHKFLPQIWFEDVMAYYSFDRELRSILFNAIETLEIALRTKIIYILSQAYGSLFYTRKELFVDSQFHERHLRDLLSEFMRSGEPFVKEYKKKYGVWVNGVCISVINPPDAWIIFEVATYGTLSKIYKNLNNQLPAKAIIANEFGLNKHTELASWIEAISYLRNIVAHHSRIWNRKLVKSPMNITNPKGLWIRHFFTDESRQKVYSIITCMLYLCNSINKKEGFKNEVISLIERNENIPIHKIGFLEHWETEPIWQK